MKTYYEQVSREVRKENYGRAFDNSSSLGYCGQILGSEIYFEAVKKKFSNPNDPWARKNANQFYNGGVERVKRVGMQSEIFNRLRKRMTNIDARQLSEKEAWSIKYDSKKMLDNYEKILGAYYDTKKYTDAYEVVAASNKMDEHEKEVVLELLNDGRKLNNSFNVEKSQIISSLESMHAEAKANEVIEAGFNNQEGMSGQVEKWKYLRNIRGVQQGIVDERNEKLANKKGLSRAFTKLKYRKKYKNAKDNIQHLDKQMSATRRKMDDIKNKNRENANFYGSLEKDKYNQLMEERLKKEME